MMSHAAMVPSRARNTTTPEEVAAVLKGSLSSLDQKVYLQVDLDNVVEAYQDVLVLLLKLTPRLNVSVLSHAASSAFEVTAQEANAWARSMVSAVSHCQSKRRSCSSGKKLPPAVFRIVQALQEVTSPRGAPVTCSSKSSLSSNQSIDLTKPVKQGRSRSPCKRDAILALYGAGGKVENKPVLPVGEDEVCILSSQETSCTPSPTVGKSGQQPASKCVQYVDPLAKALVRVADGKVIATAKMLPGPDGFARGVFPGETEEHCTDMPNLYLLPPVMKKPAAAVRKKPAALQPAPSEEEAVDEDLPEDLHTDPGHQEQEDGLSPEEANLLQSSGRPKPELKYQKMYYKASGAWAVRQGFCAKKQLFQIKNSNKTKEELEKIVDAALIKLSEGMLEEAVKTWARDAAQELE